MTSFHLDHHGTAYRIDLDADEFVMHRLANDGTWAEQARMSIEAAQVLASLDVNAVAVMQTRS